MRPQAAILSPISGNGVDWDKLDELEVLEGAQRGIHLKKLIETIRSCGVSFNVWEKRNAVEKSSGEHDWTSLPGSDKKHLLAELPSKMRLALYPVTVECIIEIWKGVETIYTDITNWAPKRNPTEFWIKANDLVKLFLPMNGQREDYERRITPYIHIMVQHFPRFLELRRSIMIFTGHGLEKDNDVARSQMMLRKSNKWDSAGDCTST